MVIHLLPESNANRTDLPYRIAAILFFAWITVMFTTPVGEGDFFWHVKTGEWIWKHHTLPNADPFSFTVSDINPYNPTSRRIPFLLKQYWLGQLFFYGTWKLAGEAGMVVVRTCCYGGILYFLYRWARKYQQGIVPLLTVIIVGKVLLNYSNERPQIFGYILMPILLYLLERGRGAGRIGRSWRQLLALPAVMLLWSNCHGSFILGMVVIVLYGAGHLIDCLLRKEAPDGATLLSHTGALLVTLLNPNGYGAFKEFFTLSRGYTSLITEYISPIELAYRHHLVDYFYLLFLIATIGTLALFFRKMAPAHILVLGALTGLSLTGTRYIPFAVMATPLLAPYLPSWAPGKALRLLPAIVVLMLMATASYTNVLKFRAERSFPVNAAKFLTQVKPAGPMFNYVSWGGYLMCYTGYPVFIDGRTLVEELLPIHNSVLAGSNWQAILDRYGINFMIIPGTDLISLQAYPLLLQLLGDDHWALVYHDEVALILLRNSPQNAAILSRYATDKSAITAHIQSRWSWQTTNDF